MKVPYDQTIMKASLLGSAAALLLCVGCDDSSSSSSSATTGAVDDPPSPIVEQDPSDDDSKAIVDLLEVLGVKLARIEQTEPKKLSIVWESEQERKVLMTVSRWESQTGFQVAVQEDSKVDILRIAIANGREAGKTLIEENPFKGRANSFYPNPREDGQGRYVIMETQPLDPPVDRIVLVMEPIQADQDADDQLPARADSKAE